MTAPPAQREAAKDETHDSTIPEGDRHEDAASPKGNVCGVCCRRPKAVADDDDVDSTSPKGNG